MSYKQKMCSRKLFPVTVTCHSVVDSYNLPLVLVEWLTIEKTVFKILHLKNIGRFWKFGYFESILPQDGCHHQNGYPFIHNLQNLGFVIYFDPSSCTSCDLVSVSKKNNDC